MLMIENEIMLIQSPNIRLLFSLIFYYANSPPPLRIFHHGEPGGPGGP